ncbi:hypothetical protein COV18_05255 [Candidatus Woesearchaeota archaeon CG10_big_fil_rev_8_21_14_0_10_37_12]|nr:MAG: hypothetical protein COV18_05255 [Candidatus Woesearchaeota archaeon CG10_big_fil_rev_8_21_14_0_10_37_12]
MSLLSTDLKGKLVISPARSVLWSFPDADLFERVAHERFGLSPEKEAEAFKTARLQPLTELLTGRDLVLGAYRALARRIISQYIPGDIKFGFETGAGASFFYDKVLKEDSELARLFLANWVQFEVNGELVENSRKRFPAADIRTGSVYDLKLSEEYSEIKKFALAVSSYDVLGFPERAARNHHKLLNSGEYFILIQDVLPGGQAILNAERVRKHIEKDTRPVECARRKRPNGEEDITKIKYRGLWVDTVDYYHNRLCGAIYSAGFEIIAEGYVTEDWIGKRRPRHNSSEESFAANYFSYDMGSLRCWQDISLNDMVKEKIRAQVIVARKN